MDLLVPFLMLATTAGDGRFGLGLGVKDVDGVLLITRVVPGSAAAAGNLEPGLRIVALAGKPVRTLVELENGLENRRVGDTLDIEVELLDPLHRIGVFGIASPLSF